MQQQKQLSIVTGGIITEEHLERSEEGLKPPAVTLIAYEHSFYGWKNSTLNLRENYKILCKGANSSAEIVSCVNERTYSLEEAVPSAYKGFFLDYPDAKNLTGTGNWSWDLTSSWQGR